MELEDDWFRHCVPAPQKTISIHAHTHISYKHTHAYTVHTPALQHTLSIHAHTHISYITDTGAQETTGVPRTTADPLSFSAVDFTLSEKERSKKFPLFTGAVTEHVEISEGDMLYLPAGWFHDVTR
jgi:hypothetical protein